MKSLEEATILNVEKEYKMKRIEKLMKYIDKDRVGLIVNMDLIKGALKTRGKILSTIANFSLFCGDLEKKTHEAQQELKKLSESFDPVNDSIINFGRSVVTLQHKLKVYEVE